MSYAVTFTARAGKDTDELPASVRDRVFKAVVGLRDNPRPPGIVAVKGEPPGNYRLRVGSFCIGYEVDDGAQLVEIWQVGDCLDFYENAKRRRK